MKRRAMGYSAVAVAMMLLIGVTASAGEGGTWVSKEGHRVQIGDDDVMFFGEGATETQLQDLADGEVRVFGVGEKQVTASRRGDKITISRTAAGETSALDTTCKIGRDDCKIITFDDDPAKVMVVIQKTRICEHGQGDCEDVDVIALGPGHHGDKVIHKMHGEGGADGAHVIRIKKTIECDDQGNCNDFEEVLGDDDGELSTVVIKTLGDHADMDGHRGKMMFIRKGDQVTLHCSEGDTTMHVDPKEADQVYLCPKHSTPLERVKSHPPVMRRHMKKVKSDSN